MPLTIINMKGGGSVMEILLIIGVIYLIVASGSKDETKAKQAQAGLGKNAGHISKIITDIISGFLR